ncbi:MAG: type IV secretory system conjugative DNA transfer family protein [Verrucomicrobiota bacterium]
MFILDGKGSELRGYLEEALRACGREKDLVVIGPNDTDATFNPLDPDWTDVKVANELIAAVNFLGGDTAQLKKTSEPFWDRAMHDVLSTLVGISRYILCTENDTQRKLTLDHLVRSRSLLTKPDAEIARMAADLAVVLDRELGTSLSEYAALATNTRQSVASSVGPVLAPFGRKPLRNVLIPQPGRQEMDLNRIVSEGKIVLLDVGEAENAVELLPAAALVKSCFARMILSRPKKATNQTRPVFVILEEFQKVLTPQAASQACEANWMDVCRWCRCGVILSTQGISSLLAVASHPLVDKIVGLCGTQMFLGSSDPSSAAYAAQSFGSKTSYQIHRTITPPFPAPLLFPRDDESVPRTEEGRVLVPVAKPVLPAERLASLPPGLIHAVLRDGSRHIIRADPGAS